MTRTMWIALFCLVGLGPAIAIKVVTRPASPVVEAAPDQDRTELALAPNEAAKSDRLPLPDIGAGSEIMPVAQPEPSETPQAAPETTRIPGRRWQDANAKALPGEVDTGEENTSNKEAELPSRFNRSGKGSGAVPSEASSAHDRQKANRYRCQQPAEAKSRSLALPAGRHGKPVEVAGPFAEMPHVKRVDALHGRGLPPAKHVAKVLYTTKYNGRTNFILFAVAVKLNALIE